MGYHHNVYFAPNPITVTMIFGLEVVDVDTLRQTYKGISVHIIVEILIHHLQLNCMGGNFFPSHQSATVPSD